MIAHHTSGKTIYRISEQLESCKREGSMVGWGQTEQTLNDMKERVGSTGNGKSLKGLVSHMIKNAL